MQANKRKKSIENLPLLNTKWVLTELFETHVSSSTDTAFITFYDNYKFSGHFSCNLFFGEFSHGKKRIKLDYFGATKMYCKDMALEEEFTKAIKMGKFMYYIEKNTLFIHNKNSIVCKFEGVRLVEKNQKIYNNHENSN
jgi:heat shock protein HslJ